MPFSFYSLLTLPFSLFLFFLILSSFSLTLLSENLTSPFYHFSFMFSKSISFVLSLFSTRPSPWSPLPHLHIPILHFSFYFNIYYFSLASNFSLLFTLSRLLKVSLSNILFLYINRIFPENTISLEIIRNAGRSTANCCIFDTKLFVFHRFCCYLY